MKIAWFCIPAHGHTNPTLGLVKELTEAGHQVYYFSFEMFRDKIERAGATFIACDGYDFEMEDKENADRVGKDKAFATELLVSSTLALDEMTTENVGEIRPDLIVCLGDMVDRSRAEESRTAYTALVKQLTAIAPVYYVDGNHELDIRDSDSEIYARLNAELKEAGAVHLQNEIVRFMIDDEDIRPEGMEPESMEPEAAAVGKALDKGASDRKGSVVNLCGITTHYYWGEAEYALVDRLRQMDGINILLCHYPESVLWYDAFEGGGLDAALCGHTHGGLIRLPFVGGVFSPEQGWWPRYDQGAYPVYTDTDKRNYGGGEGSQYLGTMIISGGLAGEHGVPRINNPKEISVVEISGISGSPAE